MMQNIKPSAPPLPSSIQTTYYNTQQFQMNRQEGETYTNWEQRVNNPLNHSPNKQPIWQSPHPQHVPAYNPGNIQYRQRYSIASLSPVYSRSLFKNSKGINCICKYCNRYQKTQVKFKNTFLNYVCKLISILTCCCCIYSCNHHSLQKKYHYCGYCTKLLGHS